MIRITNSMVWGAAGLLVAGIAGHQWLRHRARQAAEREDSSGSVSVPAKMSPRMSETRAEGMPAEGTDSGTIQQDSPETDVSPVANPLDNPVVKDMMLQSQVRRMEAYAAQAGPGDPFALTPGEIEEFRKRGDPVVW